MEEDTIFIPDWWDEHSTIPLSQIVLPHKFGIKQGQQFVGSYSPYWNISKAKLKSSGVGDNSELPFWLEEENK